jgi:glycosyltransferase involved in cell wall biosynthesis
MNKHYFIIVPADTPNGPIKGAYAFANFLSKSRDVTLVFLNNGSGANANLNPAVKKIFLANYVFGYFSKLRLYRALLAEAGGRDKVVSFSMCFYADIVNLGCKSASITCASVRGNLIENYRVDYGFLGILLALTHLLTLRFFDIVVVMTLPMANQVKKYIGKQPAIIGNFIDEKTLESFRKIRQANRVPKFVFVGSLSKRKRPSVVLKSIEAIRASGVDVRLDIVGDGLLRSHIEKQIQKDGLSDIVRMHGFQQLPYELISSADVMVLPSLSEGASRAVMEALYLGIPCVVANVDGNSELVIEGFNGALFSSIKDLPAAMLRALEISRNFDAVRPILLPKKNRQDHAVSALINLLEPGSL